MMRIGKWLVLVCALCVLSVLFMSGAALAQSAVSTSPGAEPALSLRRLSMTFLSLFWNGKSTIHHTVTTSDPQTLNDSRQLMNDIRSWHIAQGWSDIGYHFVIDRAGRIFQGRHNPWLSTRDVRGAHAWDANISSVGIALIGQFCPFWTPPPAGRTPQHVGASKPGAVAGLEV